jgi:hypothetical protein
VVGNSGGGVHGSLGGQYLLRNLCGLIQYLHNKVENLQPRIRGGGSNTAEPKFLRSQGIDSKESVPPAYVADSYSVPSPHGLFKNSSAGIPYILINQRRHSLGSLSSLLF